jgi:uncharacterized protein YgiM (DUF1202 family)
VDSTVSSAVICVLNKGERVEVTLELYDWYKIRLPKAAPAYIKKNMAACLSYTTQKYCESAKVIKNSVNIRLSPNESSPIIGKAVKDEIINIQQEKGGWYKIYPIINSYGWIHKKFINKVNPINLTQ